MEQRQLQDDEQVTEFGPKIEVQVWSIKGKRSYTNAIVPVRRAVKGSFARK
jgi:hypothetical protein